MGLMAHKKGDLKDVLVLGCKRGRGFGHVSACLHVHW